MNSLIIYKYFIRHIFREYNFLRIGTLSRVVKFAIEEESNRSFQKVKVEILPCMCTV